MFASYQLLGAWTPRHRLNLQTRSADAFHQLKHVWEQSVDAFGKGRKSLQAPGGLRPLVVFLVLLLQPSHGCVLGDLPKIPKKGNWARDGQGVSLLNTLHVYPCIPHVVGPPLPLVG